MDNKIDVSNSAEANALKVSGNTVNFNLGEGDKTFPNRILRSFNPVWYEKREAKAREIKAESISKTISNIMSNYPIMTQQRATMEAMGYSMTNEQADNLFNISNKANKLLEETNEDIKPISPEARDLIVDGASHAYDKNIQDMWAKLIAGEISNPGTFSRKSMNILSEISSEEAKAFQVICSYLISMYDNLLVLCQNDSNPNLFNNGDISNADTMRLESLGLLDSTRTKSFTIQAGQHIPFFVSIHEPIIIFNETNHDKRLMFNPILTPYGSEISSLCKDIHNTGKNLVKFIKSIGERQGLTILTDPKEIASLINKDSKDNNGEE